MGSRLVESFNPEPQVFKALPLKTEALRIDFLAPVRQRVEFLGCG
jgi:hypothetical protein